MSNRAHDEWEAAVLRHQSRRLIAALIVLIMFLCVLTITTGSV